MIIKSFKLPNGRIAHQYEKRWGLRSKAIKIGVDKLPANQRQRRDILILGSGRCGTTTLAAMLQKIGVDVRHETVGMRGTSSLYFTVDSDWSPKWHWEESKIHYGERRSDYLFNNVIHVVRDPLKTIPSMGGIFPALNYEYFEDNDIIPPGIKSQRLRCMHAWFNLNRLSEKQSDYRFKIETLSSVWPKMLQEMNLDRRIPMPTMMVRNKASGYRKREPLTYADLSNEDDTLARAIGTMAYKYGYR